MEQAPGDWLGHCRIFHFFTFFTPGLVLLYVLGHYPFVLWSTAQSTLLHLTESVQTDSISLYTSEFIRLLPSSVTSSINTSNQVPLEAMHVHAITLLHHASQMMLYALDHELFQAFSILFSSQDSGTGWSYFQPSKECFFRSGLAILDVFWQSLIWPCLHLVVNPLYLLSWSLLLIVDFDSNTPAFWRVFFTWLDVVKGFFFTRERILKSSTTVVLRGRPGLFMLLSSSVCSFFLRMSQTVDLATPNVPAISLMDFVHNNFQMQMAHLESTPDLLPA